jgi:hypothetical protein
VAAILLCLVCCLLPGIKEARDGEGWVCSQSSLRQIGLALIQYHDMFHCLPPAVVTAKDGKSLYSWRVLLLPFLEEKQLYDRFNLEEPWDSPHNRPLADVLPYCYAPRMVGFPRTEPGQTHYQVLVGPGTAFERPGLTFKDFSDGPANTILVVEAAEAVPWSQPLDLPYDPDVPLPRLGGLFTRTSRIMSYPVYYRSGFNAVFGDGTTRFVGNQVGAQTIRSLITRNGGEAVDLSRLE